MFFALTLDDDEFLTLTRALRTYAAICQTQIELGFSSPFEADLAKIKDFQRRLFESEEGVMSPERLQNASKETLSRIGALHGISEQQQAESDAEYLDRVKAAIEALEDEGT